MILGTSVKERLKLLNTATSHKKASAQGPEYPCLVVWWGDSRVGLGPLGWLALDRSDKTLAEGSVEDPQALPRAERVIALIDSHHVTPLVLDLPKLSAKRQSQALQWAAEEFVAGPIEDEHVVAGKRNAAGQLQALTIQDVLMEQAQETLQRARVDVLLPDALCLPYQPGNVSIALWNGRLLIRWGEWSFGAFEPHVGLMMLEDLTDQAWLWWGDAPPPEALEARVARQASDQSVMAVLAQEAKTAPINLLSGPYQGATSHVLRSQWAWVGGLLAVIGLVALVSLAVERQLLAHEAKTLRGEVASTFQTLFPNQPAIGRERELVMRELARLQYGRSAGLLELLSRVMPLLAGQSDLSMEALTFQAGALSLTVRAPNVASLDAFGAQIRNSGLSASVESATLSEDGASGQVIIQRGDR